MNRRNENFGIAAVVLIIAALLAWQFWPTSDVATSDTSFQVKSTTEFVHVVEYGDTSTVVVYEHTVFVDELPLEAIDTLRLIDTGGPYPYRKDGSTFQNREGLLPDHPHGHYREFTVETPGSPDRGARRIVAGDDGELFWTDDHYDSFSQIVGW